MTTHLITGVAGQDGILMARQLLREGGRVIGTVRPGSSASRRMAPYLTGVEVVEQDLRDTEGLGRLLSGTRPDEVYNFAAISSVGASWHRPAEAEETNGVAVVRLLDLLADHPATRLLQASSGAEYGLGSSSPYARGKAIARAAVARAREQGQFACSAILYNHESPVRGRAFVTRKISRGVAEIKHGVRKHLTLGDLQVRRDWGAATDYVRAMRLMMSGAEPSEYVVATGISRPLTDFLVLAFEACGLGAPWRYIQHDPELVRPADAAELVGDPGRIMKDLAWRPTLSLQDVVSGMVRADLLRMRSGVEEKASYLQQ